VETKSREQMMSQQGELPLSSNILTSAWLHIHILPPRKKSVFIVVQSCLTWLYLKWNLEVKFDSHKNLNIMAYSTLSQIFEHYGSVNILKNTLKLWTIHHSHKRLNIVVCFTLSYKHLYIMLKYLDIINCSVLSYIIRCNGLCNMMCIWKRSKIVKMSLCLIKHHSTKT
jgi:hypothetical protein